MTMDGKHGSEMKEDDRLDDASAGRGDVVIEGHRYDGIREYDNPMPGWWVWTFVATVIFAAIYGVGLHVFGFIDSYEDDLSQSLEALEAQRASFATGAVGFDASAAALAAHIANPEAVSSGASTYDVYCAACHGGQGQGLIGPNLTDEYWLHGGSPEAIYHVITEGVPAKGMPPWEASLSPEARADVVAFIVSIVGSDPPNAKGPEGE